MREGGDGMRIRLGGRVRVVGVASDASSSIDVERRESSEHVWILRVAVESWETRRVGVDGVAGSAITAGEGIGKRVPGAASSSNVAKSTSRLELGHVGRTSIVDMLIEVDGFRCDGPMIGR